MIADLPVPHPRHERTVLDVLERVSSTYPDVEAYVDGDQRVTYYELAARSAGVARRLRDLGVRFGDVVAIRLPTSVEYALAYLGALRVGAVATGINPRLGRREVEGIVARARPAVTVVEQEVTVVEQEVTVVEQETVETDAGGGAANSTAANATAANSTAGGAAFISRAEVASAPSDDPTWRPVDIGPDTPVAIVWTSGTTGTPKGAVFDHSNLEALSHATGELSAPFDCRLSPVPFAHVGYMTRLWDEIGNAMTSVIVPTPWSADTALDLLESERVTVGQGVPTQWELMLRQPGLEDRDLGALRLIATGAAKVPARLVFELQRRFGCPVVVRYATTEASVISGTLRSDPPEVIEQTVGGPCPTVDVRVTDDAGKDLPVGEVGMIEVRSKAMMRCYLGSEHESPIRADGWLVTGDAGSLDEAGRVRLVGRRSEMYVRGGYNVYPLEVEQVICEHPSVAEAAVVGVPDGVLGSRGVVWVVPALRSEPPQLDALRAWCEENLADYKAPDDLVVVDSLPRNQMGKVDKRSLAAGFAG